MSGRYLLDTNIAIALFANETEVIDSLSQAEELFVPCIVLGELCFGARKSVRVKENLLRVDDFAASNVVLSCDTENSATLWGNQERVTHQGTPIA